MTGLLVLGGAAVAAQRAAVAATQREMVRSADEVARIIGEGLERSAPRPGALRELLRLLEGDTLRPNLSRLLRSAGGSELAFAVLTPDGTLRGADPLFSRVGLDPYSLLAGDAAFVRSDADELVVIRPMTIEPPRQDFTLLIGLARTAPVVRPGDLGRGWLLVGVGMVLLSALLARILSSQLVSRLAPLSAASRRLADGDLSVRVPDLGDPELVDVGEAFNEMAGELEASREREREFLLGVGHDVRTPLTTIRGYAEALETGLVDPGEISRIGSVLATQTRQLGRLIEDLTLLARLEQPEFDLRPERVDVAAHLTEVVEGFTPRAEQVGIVLSVTAGRGVEATTDPDRLGQIVQNLVENALRYTPEGGEVRVGVGRDGDALVVEVTDTGTGIHPDDLPHVFNRHYVGRQRRIRDEGSGLGLSIVAALVDRMGGSVTAESAPGGGTTITVRLPLGR